MARIRSIHPGLFTDEAFMSVSAEARLLFVGLWCEADDGGVFEWKPLTLKARLFPADAVNVVDLLADLSGQDMVRAFAIDGRQFGAIRNFGRYQRPKAPKMVHPFPDDLAAYLARDGNGVPGPMNHPRDVTASERKQRQRDNERDGSGKCHASSVTNSENVTAEPAPFPQNGEVSRQMKEEGGSMKEEVKKEKETRPAAPDALLAEFSEIFWPAYPEKVGKPVALKAFCKARKSVALEPMMEGLRRYVLGKPADRPWCHPSTWLNGERWADQPAPSLPAHNNQFPFASNRQEPRNGNRIIDALGTIRSRLEDFDGPVSSAPGRSFTN